MLQQCDEARKLRRQARVRTDAVCFEPDGMTRERASMSMFAISPECAVCQCAGTTTSLWDF